jgi:hypothetical protein
MAAPTIRNMDPISFPFQTNGIPFYFNSSAHSYLNPSCASASKISLAISGGVKFCSLGSAACSFSSHSKKVAISSSHIYISTGHNSAFTNHHAPIYALLDSDLHTLLQERHSEKGWIQLLHIVDQIPTNREHGQGDMSEAVETDLEHHGEPHTTH